MTTIWVTGSKGQLGNEIFLLQDLLSGCQFLFTDIEELDLCNSEDVIEFAKAKKPEIIVNCAAYTAVDKAEEEEEKAFLLNRDVPALLAEISSQITSTLIHISTDYVFDGQSYRPYTEKDIPNPSTNYGRSKLAGEEAVLKNKQNIVIRTSWLYSPHGKNFLKTILRLGKERDKLEVVFDQVGTPTSATDLARATLQIIEKLIDTSNDVGGIYNFSNEGACSWYDFAVEIVKIAGLDCTVEAITSEQFRTLATRPFYSVLDKSKIRKAFNLSIPHWRDSLGKCFTRLNN
ncbi:dTDP-4-dehydrorhamnose reductase [subsurface metagenome]